MRLSRIFSVLLFLVVLFAFFAFSASATGTGLVDPYEFAEVVDNGITKTITMTIPAGYGYINIQSSWNGTMWEALTTGSGREPLRYTLKDGQFYKVAFLPFGDSRFGDVHGVDVTNIPNGAQVTLRFKFDRGSSNTVPTYGHGSFVFHDSDGNQLMSQGFDSMATPLFNQLVEHTFILNKPTDASYAACQFSQEYYQSGDWEEAQFILYDTIITFEIGGDYAFNPIPPEEQDILDRLGLIESDLLGQVDQGFDQATNIITNASSVITSLRPALLAAGACVSQFLLLDSSDAPGFYQVANISLSLGIVGSLLSLAGSASKGGKGDSGGKKKKGG